MPRDPNMPVSANSRRPDPTSTKSATGMAQKDGYTVTARRPRVPFYDEHVSLERADEMERSYNDMGLLSDDY